MYLLYVPNRHVHEAFLGAMTNPLLDEQGMVPYTGKPLTFEKPASSATHVISLNRKKPGRSSRIHLGDEALSFAPIVENLVSYCATKPFYQEIEFTLSNNTVKARVEAVIYAGTLNCLITPSSDELLRKLLLAKKEAARDLYRQTNFAVHLDIADEIRIGKL